MDPSVRNEGNPIVPSAKKRKPRPKLSCVLCRQKKLKCNRMHPCDNCIKHKRPYMCHYQGPPGIPMKGSQDIHNHIHDLEARMQQLSGATVQSSFPSFPQSNFPPSGLTAAEVQAGPSAAEEVSEPQGDYPGTILVDQDGTRYINPTHWQAVLDEIAEVKQYLQLNENSPLEDAEEETSAPEVSGPVLLFGNLVPSTKADLLAALPDRPAADRLVSFYLNSKEATLVLMHIPTFAKEYAAFWKNPEDVSINWLAYLYSILCISTGLHLFSASGRADGHLAEAFDEYHRLASQCLTIAEYTTPGRYKLEALVMNVASEILRSADTHTGPSVLLGLASRLAMHSGYHRDPDHYREISVFDGEMRRRVWMYLSLLDHYISCQIGLPPSTMQAQSDTQEPRNLTDEDLDPSATVLPTSRPLTEKTSILFPVFLNRIMFAGAEITSKVCSVKGVPYREVLHLDAKLRKLHETVPHPLCFRPPSESIADSPTTIMDRYNIDLMYQKARSDLHRRYLTQHRRNPKYAYSRRECLDAARRVLQHQADIFDASSPGGQLGLVSFFFSSCVIMHFRVAAMIVCLEISCQSRHDLQQNLSPGERQSILAQRHQLSQDLERSYRIWNRFRSQSKEALKTAEALAIMLRITNTHLQHGATPPGHEQSPPPVALETQSFTPTSDLNSQFDVSSMIPLLPVTFEESSPQDIQYQGTPFDVDLMDATFYLGQDVDTNANHAAFSGPTNNVDFFDRYWDNLMLLGGDQPSNGIALPTGNYDGADLGL
ncbi:hypothetical protein BO70DRAFT_397011 [Aspergillus heteromorphus CBS 117.55]|uniref:Zn(2)-C6 fungal-type domain-containing protein n=1 Tax=Aspergillus heteromorphus CBS 117.55 TaxID=1448321 RepID=A0A317W437_9EURO|nr:uncharacterized protein BO70DRAFT_397011 [Aspergillus heteromorphus CBS 117.55]PWY80719.1 hypothetical protein BO70DRAFT_397011 [Aspergillus heteromorphus CBS 117.55]